MRLSIRLTLDEFDRLRCVAASERRDPREQAALFIVQALDAAQAHAQPQQCPDDDGDQPVPAAIASAAA